MAKRESNNSSGSNRREISGGQRGKSDYEKRARKDVNMFGKSSKKRERWFLSIWKMIEGSDSAKLYSGNIRTAGMQCVDAWYNGLSLLFHFGALGKWSGSLLILRDKNYSSRWFLQNPLEKVLQPEIRLFQSVKEWIPAGSSSDLSRLLFWERQDIRP